MPRTVPVLALGALLALGATVFERRAPEPRERSEAAAPSVRLLLLGRFSEPTYLTAPPGDRDRRFVVERAGRIRVVRGGRKLEAPFLDIAGSVQTGGESGMLSMAFAPDYERSGLFYVYYTDNSGDIRIEEYKRSESSPDRALPGSRRLVLAQDHQRFNHKGGQIQFGPDGMLWTAFGDGGGAHDPSNNAQNLDRLLGKLLRIDTRRRGRGGYGVPRGNPFRGGRDEVYAFGLRNPYRFSFDRRRGHLVLGDVGQDMSEEIDFVPRRRGRRVPRGGQNFGWPIFEGRSRLRNSGVSRYHPPALVKPTARFCAIIAGFVVRDRGLPRRLQGRVVYGDNCNPDLRIARLSRRRASRDRSLGVRVGSLSSFGEDARGRLYVTSLNGPVYRIARR